ncbi:MAG: hypothetical protein P4M02_09895 [Clostridia bacterium]|nr:hypothetical protein [Clostridia bacterium]
MEKKYLTILFAVFAAGTLAVIPMRIAELFFAIDSSGFYISGNKIVPFLDVFLIIFTLALLSPFFVPRVQNAVAWREGSKVSGVIALLLGLEFCVEIVLRFSVLFGYGQPLNAGATYKESAGSFVIAVAALLTAVYFLMLAFRHLTGRQIGLGGASLFPVIWGVVILTVSFMQYTTIANISELLFDVLRMVFVLIFFYYNARVTGGVPSGREYRGLVAFGMPAALFCVVSTLPRLIAHMINSSHGEIYDYFDVFSILLGLTLAAYIIDLLAEGIFRRRAYALPPAEGNAQTDESR